MHIVATLVEKDFLYGACALFNSLVQRGFAGRFVIGCRDQTGMPKGVIDAIAGAGGGRVDWIRVNTPIHFGNYKPWFMEEVFAQFSEARKVTYMDPDIVCLCPFDWIDSWSDGGPAVCADVNWMMPSNHPTRHEWLRLSGLVAQHKLDLYFNSGFLSLRREDAAFLRRWIEFITNFGSRDNPLDAKGDIADWRKVGRWTSFLSPNQCTLNLALMTWGGGITTLGPDAMGFSGSDCVLPHALGADKPWRRNFLADAVRGYPPRTVDKEFWNHTSKPVKIFGKYRLSRTKILLKIAAFVGRFYARR